jgi:hypothetical protein
MVGKARIVAAVVVLGALAALPRPCCRAQAVLAPPGAETAVPQVRAAGPDKAGPGPGTAVGNRVALPDVPCASPGPQPPCNPWEDRNGPVLKGDEFLDDKGDSPPGWFGALEAGLVASHIRNHLTNQVSVAGGTDTVHLPTADLDWTVSPRFELGYRFAQAAGELLLAYRFLVTSGSQVLPGFDANGDPAALHSRLDMHAWDFDYGNWENALLPWCEMKWRIGARLATVFFDSTANSSLLEQHTSNYFIGAGPHIGLDLRHTVACSDFAVFGRVEGAFLVGRASQSFEEIVGAGPGSVGGATRAEQTTVAPWVGVQAGVEWAPLGAEHLRLSVGYTFEHWWNFGDVGDSHAEVITQGVFLRGEIRY